MSLIDVAISPAEVAQIVGPDYFEERINTVACMQPETRDVFRKLRDESGWNMSPEATELLGHVKSLCGQCAILDHCGNLAPTTGEARWRGIFDGLTARERFERTDGHYYDEEVSLSMGMSVE